MTGLEPDNMPKTGACGPIDMPDIGSVVAHRTGTDALYLPSNILLPGTDEQADSSHVGFLPPGFAAFKTGGSPADPPRLLIGFTAVHPGHAVDLVVDKGPDWCAGLDHPPVVGDRSLVVRNMH